MNVCAAVLQPSRAVMEVLFYTVARLSPRLSPLDAQTHDNLYCRIISSLTHQNMVLGLDALTPAAGGMTSQLSSSANPTAAGMMRSHLADRLMHFFVSLTRHFHENMHQAKVRKSQITDHDESVSHSRRQERAPVVRKGTAQSVVRRNINNSSVMSSGGLAESAGSATGDRLLVNGETGESSAKLTNGGAADDSSPGVNTPSDSDTESSDRGAIFKAVSSGDESERYWDGSGIDVPTTMDES